MASTDAPRAFHLYTGMGINPDMLKMSMKVMKANPNVIKMAQEQMAKMSPEQMKQASDLAQKQMEAMAPEDLEKMADSAIAGAGGPQVVDVDVEEDAPARNARDEALVDALFVVAAAMSKQPGAVMLEAFKQLPPIQSLRGELPDDLSDAEIADASGAVCFFSTPSTRRRITGSFPQQVGRGGARRGRRGRQDGVHARLAGAGPALRRRHDDRGAAAAEKDARPRRIIRGS